MMEVMEVDLRDHFDHIKPWWDAHGWGDMQKALLSPLGFYVPKYAAIFLYTTNSPMAWLEFAVTNPAADFSERSKALDLCMDRAALKAKNLGFTVLMASLNHEGLIKRYQRHAFVVTEEKMTNLVRIL